MNSVRSFLPLLVGLALGAGGAGIVRRELSASRSSVTLSVPSPSSPAPSAAASIPSGSLLLASVRLAPADAETALDAWLALGAPDSGAPAADYATQVAELRALLAVLPDSLFPRLLSALIDRPGEDARRLRQIAFDIWTERAPADAARWIIATSTGPNLDARARVRLGRQALAAWGRADFDAALAWARTLPDSDFSHALFTALLAQLAATDPHRALELARAQGPDLVRASQNQLLLAWSETDPAAALATLGPLLLDTDPNSRALANALARWMDRDAASAFAWIMAQPPPPGGSDSYHSWQRDALRVAAYSLSDLRPVADALLPHLASTTVPDQLSDLLSRWTAKDPAAALAWARANLDPTRDADLLLRGIPSHDELAHPEHYLPLALLLPPGPARDTKLAELLANVARGDPDAASAWLLAHHDPSLAPVADRLQGALLGTLAATDPAAALAGWQNLPPGEARLLAAPKLASSWATKDPAAATRWLFDQLPPLPAYANDADTYLTWPWSPDAKTKLGQSIPEYLPHLETYEYSLATWYQRDPLGALAWGQSLPDPAWRQKTVRGMLNLSAPWDYSDPPEPVARADTLAKIPDPALRADALARHLKNWLRADVRLAREWIESHDALSPEQAAALLSAPGS